MTNTHTTDRFGNHGLVVLDLKRAYDDAVRRHRYSPNRADTCAAFEVRHYSAAIEGLMAFLTAGR